MNAYFHDSLVDNPIVIQSGSISLIRTTDIVTKPTVLPAQTSMCESVRLRSVNDVCYVVMQKRIATLKDRKMGNSVNIGTYKCEVHIFSFALAPSIL